MSNRLDLLFEDRSAFRLSIFFTAGFPQLEDTTALIEALQYSGADLLEIGFPFSDPLADGPVIQSSSQQALANGMSLTVLFEQLQEIRRRIHIPLVLMGYLNPVLQFGMASFIEQCVVCGIDGVILPDLPADVYVAEYKKEFDAAGLAFIPLITPQTSPERIRFLDEQCSGFIYMVAGHGTTGGAISLQEEASYFQRVKEMGLRLPKVAGFGVKSSSDIAFVQQYTEGVILGSAFVQHIADGFSNASIRSFIGGLSS